MISPNEYQTLKKIITKLERERDELSGAIKQIEQTLKEEFDCNSLEEAERLLLKLNEEYKKSETQFRKRLRIFLRKNKTSLKQYPSEDIEILRRVAFSQTATGKRKKGS